MGVPDVPLVKITSRVVGKLSDPTYNNMLCMLSGMCARTWPLKNSTIYIFFVSDISSDTGTLVSHNRRHSFLLMLLLLLPFILTYPNSSSLN